MEHGGNIRSFEKESKKEKILDFSANINPLGIPSWVRLILQRNFFSLAHYPDPDYILVRKVVADYYGLNINNVIPVNGISEALCFINQILEIKKVILLNPAFSEYKRGAENSGAEIIELNSLIERSELISLIEKKLTDSDAIVYINNPQNPTGERYSKDEILHFVKKYPYSYFIIDEAFIEFTGIDGLGIKVSDYSNLIILKSYTKLLALPGLRLGVVLGNSNIIEKMKSKLPTWNVNTLSSKVLEYYYSNNPKQYIEKVYLEVKKLKNNFFKKMKDFPIEINESVANYLLLKFIKKDALEVFNFLLKEKGIATRRCDNFIGLNPHEYLRVAVRPEDEQEQLITALSEYYKLDIIKRNKKTPAIMLQGTTSNAGKSLLATALCRIFQEDGYNVSPFKSQNMALNSFVTKEGGEIGRAQAIQAQACKKDASILMNPILLKPNSDTQSQVILNGKPVKHMYFKEYFEKKLEYFEDVKKSYDQLAKDSDFIVLEGAGSPAEINLKSKDIVNMNMAKYANANVYITADIDRGGMFASFLGTLSTFKEWENSLVKGLIINRFRGDKSLLDPGIKYLDDILGIPIVGCIPNIQNHMIPEEDCIEFKAGSFNDRTELKDRLDIAVIDTPRISNFTDIDALRGEPDVRLRMVSQLKELGRPDIILLCGSKSVVSDLNFMKEAGLDRAILSMYSLGHSEIIGICGGHQFLSSKILDPHGVESNIKSFEGLNLLELKVEIGKDKKLSQVKAEFLPWRYELTGYEIHHGISTPMGTNLKEIVRDLSTNKVIGHSSLDGRVWGSYLHGIFDNNKFRRKFLDYHRSRVGKMPLGKIVYEYDVEKSIQDLAKIVRSSMDIDKIYQDLNL